MQIKQIESQLSLFLSENPDVQSSFTPKQGHHHHNHLEHHHAHEVTFPFHSLSHASFL